MEMGGHRQALNALPLDRNTVPIVEEVGWVSGWFWKDMKESKSTLFFIIQLEPRIVR
jgi:hypothetical protein